MIGILLVYLSKPKEGSCMPIKALETISGGVIIGYMIPYLIFNGVTLW
jgi:hypothetical protein